MSLPTPNINEKDIDYVFKQICDILKENQCIKKNDNGKYSLITPEPNINEVFKKLSKLFVVTGRASKFLPTQQNSDTKDENIVALKDIAYSSKEYYNKIIENHAPSENAILFQKIKTELKFDVITNLEKVVGLIKFQNLMKILYNIEERVSSKSEKLAKHRKSVRKPDLEKLKSSRKKIQTAKKSNSFYKQHMNQYHQTTHSTANTEDMSDIIVLLEGIQINKQNTPIINSEIKDVKTNIKEMENELNELNANKLQVNDDIMFKEKIEKILENKHNEIIYKDFLEEISKHKAQQNKNIPRIFTKHLLPGTIGYLEYKLKNLRANKIKSFINKKRTTKLTPFDMPNQNRQRLNQLKKTARRAPQKRITNSEPMIVENIQSNVANRMNLSIH